MSSPRKRRKDYLEDDVQMGKADLVKETEVFEIEPKDTLNEGHCNSEVEDGQYHFQIHPLLIPHVIENILGILFGPDPSDMLRDVNACRLVCKRWHEISSKLHRRGTEDLVFGEKDRTDTKKMKRFLKVMDKTEEPMFEKFRFDPGFFVHRNQSLFTKFLHTCNPFIVHLKLWFDNECTLGFSKRCYPNLALDSLEYLFFGCVNYRGKASTENLELTYILDGLLHSARNLKKFCFSFPPKDFKCQQIIIKRFGEMIGSKIPKTVKNLKLEMKITDMQLEALANTQLSLDTLHFDFRGSKLTRSVLHRLLECQKNTLQEMRLLDSEIKYDYELEFPTFKKLTVLEIQGGKIMPFSYREQFPVLERLILFGWENPDSLKTMLESTTSCLCLANLELPYKISDERLVYLAAKCFPNLKKLEITPTVEGMPAVVKVFECMTDLKELEITFPFIIEEELNVDSVFTGIPKEDCVRILEAGDLDAIKIQDVQRRTSITNLTKLEKLIIQDHSNEIRLTDITTHFGLLQLENLVHLEIGRFQMSDRVFQLLNDKVSVTQSYESSSDSELETSDDENSSDSST